MQKTDIIDVLASRNNLSKLACQRFLEAFIDTARTELARGGKISLCGVGSFNVVEIKPRWRKQPGTTNELLCPPTKQVRFKRSSKIKSL